jgi:hypothetical protein
METMVFTDFLNLLVQGEITYKELDPNGKQYITYDSDEDYGVVEGRELEFEIPGTNDYFFIHVDADYRNDRCSGDYWTPPSSELKINIDDITVFDPEGEIIELETELFDKLLDWVYQNVPWEQ